MSFARQLLIFCGSPWAVRMHFRYALMFAPLDAPWRDAVATPPIEVDDGRVAIPDGPGLGIELDETELAKHPFVPRDLNLLEDESILERSVLPEDVREIDLVE